MTINKEVFGKIEGEEVYLFTLKNDNLVVKITNYGATITHIIMPDKEGIKDDVVLGFDSLDGYLGNHPYIGVTVGRFCNRINGGKFTIDQVDYQLPVNQHPNHLHGGVEGFDKKIWDYILDHNSNRLVLSYFSKDGEEGFPGNLEIKVEFTLTQDDELKIQYFATTDKVTHVNFTNHTYFNLSGGKENIYNHNLRIEADQYTPTDSTGIPTGEILSVKNSILDFTNTKRVGEDIDKTEKGYDNNFVLRDYTGQLQKVATLSHLANGRTMDVYTTEPGIQLYTAGYFDGKIIGKNDITYVPFMGLCLETQHFPDSPNHKNFPSTLLEPGKQFSSLTIYKFTV